MQFTAKTENVVLNCNFEAEIPTRDL